MARDLEKDLELCNKATKGPWYTVPKEGTPNRLIATTSFFGSGKIYTRGQDANPGSDLEFIAEAREGWPEAIERAIEAEKSLEIIDLQLKKELEMVRDKAISQKTFIDDLIQIAKFTDKQVKLLRSQKINDNEG